MMTPFPTLEKVNVPKYILHAWEYGLDKYFDLVQQYEEMVAGGHTKEAKYLKVKIAEQSAANRITDIRITRFIKEHSVKPDQKTEAA